MKKIVVIVLTVMMFLSATFIGVANVYRIDHVVLDAKMFSAAAKDEAAKIQLALQEAYAGESILFADGVRAEELVKEYPYFRITKLEKRKPNVLYVEAVEDMEVFAVRVGDDYSILSQSGTVLTVRKDSKNRVDGEANIVIEGANPIGEIGQEISGAGFAELFKVCSILSEKLNGLRANIERIEFDRVDDGGRIFFCMREGVKICLVHANILTESKAEKMADEYLNMSPEQRLTGFLHVTESLDGTRVLAKNQTELFE
jgi:hypothetical protein